MGEKSALMRWNRENAGPRRLWNGLYIIPKNGKMELNNKHWDRRQQYAMKGWAETNLFENMRLWSGSAWYLPTWKSTGHVQAGMWDIHGYIYWIYMDIYTGYTGLLDIFNNGVGLIGYRRGRLDIWVSKVSSRRKGTRVLDLLVLYHVPALVWSFGTYSPFPSFSVFFPLTVVCQGTITSYQSLAVARLDTPRWVIAVHLAVSSASPMSPLSLVIWPAA